MEKHRDLEEIISFLKARTILYYFIMNVYELHIELKRNNRCPWYWNSWEQTSLDEGEEEAEKKKWEVEEDVNVSETKFKQQ